MKPKLVIPFQKSNLLLKVILSLAGIKVACIYMFGTISHQKLKLLLSDKTAHKEAVNLTEYCKIVNRSRNSQCLPVCLSGLNPRCTSCAGWAFNLTKVVFLGIS